MNLLYLCDFRSPGFEILSYGSPLSPISKPIGLIKIGFFKKELFSISHDDLIIDWFSRDKLYKVPCFIVATFGPKNDTQQLQSVVVMRLFTKFESNPQRESYVNFPNVTYLTWNSGACKNPNFLRTYLRKYRELRSEILSQGSSRFQLKWVLILASKASQKKVIAKMPR